MERYSLGSFSWQGQIAMKRLFIGIAAAASLLATNAIAADLAPRPYTKAPVIMDPGYTGPGSTSVSMVAIAWGRANETVGALTPFPAGVSQNVDGGLD